MNIDTHREMGGEGRPLTRADVEHRLREVDGFEKLNLALANLEGVDLSHFDLSGADLSGANLIRANLIWADLRGADLSDANLSRATLNDAVLIGADLSRAKFSGADLSSAKLIGTFMIGVDLSGADLSGVIISESQKEQLRDSGVIGLSESVQTAAYAPTIRIRILEEPLTAPNLTTIISALTELSTKCWLIAKGRFADLIEYTQTHNPQFAEEANTIITRASYNSPFVIDWKIDVSPQGLAEGITKIALMKKTIEEAELKNQEKAQAIKHDQQKAEQEQQTAQLEQEKKELEIERQRLELLEKRLEIQKKGIKYALEIASELVDMLQPNADQATKAMRTRGKAALQCYELFSSGS